MNNSKLKQPPECERIAKKLSRAGVCSRRQAEKFIFEGRIKVNGLTITTPATKVSIDDIILFEDIESSILRDKNLPDKDNSLDNPVKYFSSLVRIKKIEDSDSSKDLNKFPKIRKLLYQGNLTEAINEVKTISPDYEYKFENWIELCKNIEDMADLILKLCERKDHKNPILRNPLIKNYNSQSQYSKKVSNFIEKVFYENRTN